MCQVLWNLTEMWEWQTSPKEKKCTTMALHLKSPDGGRKDFPHRMQDQANLYPPLFPPPHIPQRCLI